MALPHGHGDNLVGNIQSKWTSTWTWTNLNHVLPNPTFKFLSNFRRWVINIAHARNK